MSFLTGTFLHGQHSWFGWSDKIGTPDCCREMKSVCLVHNLITMLVDNCNKIIIIICGNVSRLDWLSPVTHFDWTVRLTCNRLMWVLFHRSVDINGVCWRQPLCLLFRIAVRFQVISSVFWVITQHRLVKHWRFGTTCRSHLYGSNVKGVDTWPMKMGPTGCPETSVLNQTTLPYSPENRRIQVNRSGNLRSRLFAFIYQHRITIQSSNQCARRRMCRHTVTPSLFSA